MLLLVYQRVNHCLKTRLVPYWPSPSDQLPWDICLGGGGNSSQSSSNMLDICTFVEDVVFFCAGELRNVFFSNNIHNIYIYIPCASKPLKYLGYEGKPYPYSEGKTAFSQVKPRFRVKPSCFLFSGRTKKKCRLSLGQHPKSLGVEGVYSGLVACFFNFG